MIASTALLAGPAAGQALNQGLGINLKRDHTVQGFVHLLQVVLQSIRLCNRAWEAIQDETVVAVSSQKAVTDYADNNFIGDQSTGIHILLGLAAHRRTFFYRGAEDVSGRDLRNGKPFRQHLGLCPLTGAGRSEQYQLHPDPPDYPRRLLILTPFMKPS